MARVALFTETFNGADQNPLSDAGAWTSNPSSWAGGVKRALSKAQPINAATHSAARCETAIGHNQYAKATGVNADAAATALTAVCTRMQADGSCYALYYYPIQPTLSLYRFDSGAFTLLNAIAIGTGSNNTVELRSVGSRHWCYFNGVRKFSWQDTTYATGKTGMAFYNGGAGTSIAYFEAGTSDGVVDEFGLNTALLPNFTLFELTENPLSESSVWAKPAINAGSDATRHWYDGMKKSDGATGATANQHDAMYHTGSFTASQYAAAVVVCGAWAGVVTRMATNGDCYLLFQYSTDNTLRLYKYVDAGDAGAPADGFQDITIAVSARAFVPAADIVLIELWSQGSTHSVYVTNPGGARTLLYTFVDASYSNALQPGIANFDNGAPSAILYAFWGGNIPSSGGGGGEGGGGLASGIGFKTQAKPLLQWN